MNKWDNAIKNQVNYNGQDKNYLINNSFSHFNRFSYKNSKGKRDNIKLKIEKRFESPKIVKAIHSPMLKSTLNLGYGNNNKYQIQNNKAMSQNEILKSKIGLANKNCNKKVRLNVRIRPDIVFDSYWKGQIK